LKNVIGEDLMMILLTQVIGVNLELIIFADIKDLCKDHCFIKKQKGDKKIKKLGKEYQSINEQLMALRKQVDESSKK
jgi:peptidoglycan hydrolase CwlO-like protein